jgi:hypothetical protein
VKGVEEMNDQIAVGIQLAAQHCMRQMGSTYECVCGKHFGHTLEIAFRNWRDHILDLAHPASPHSLDKHVDYMVAKTYREAATWVEKMGPVQWVTNGLNDIARQIVERI